jgi:N-acetylglucosaminyldiphosphoundecaprenol N-acetyl-beta-D-mannosaminyltransferase
MAKKEISTPDTHDDVYYDSWKEDRDLILEYNGIDLTDAGVSNILGIGVDNVSRSQAILKLSRMIEEGGVHHVIPVNPYKLIRFRSNKELNLIYSASDMKLASGAGVLWASKKVGFPLRERVDVLSFLMELVRLAEIKEYSIFIVGGRPEVAEQAFFNIKKSFPKIRIVGRHGGFFNSDREISIVEAMRKSQANIIIVGLGFPYEDRWITKNREMFKNAVFISVGGALDIISGVNRKAPAFFAERGLDWLYRIITRPWRYGRLLRVVFFDIRLFFYGLFRKK